MTVLQDLRVLVVENDEMSAALLQMQLVHAGATVVGLAASVSEALLLEQQAPGRGPAGLPAGPQRDQ
jgi:CheY-like chemotaxis protein